MTDSLTETGFQISATWARTVNPNPRCRLDTRSAVIVCQPSTAVHCLLRNQTNRTPKVCQALRSRRRIRCQTPDGEVGSDEANLGNSVWKFGTAGSRETEHMVSVVGHDARPLVNVQTDITVRKYLRERFVGGRKTALGDQLGGPKIMTLGSCPHRDGGCHHSVHVNCMYLSLTSLP